MSTATALAVAAALVPTTGLVGTPAQAAPVGQGFHLNAHDLRFILKQIKIAEHHAATATAGNPCGTLLGEGPHQIPDTGNNAEELPWGLRTVDGSCNNLMPGRERWGAADESFPRRTEPVYEDAEPSFDYDGPFGPAEAGLPSSYKQKNGNVFDSEPRVISNLIVDQTAANPAAVAAAGADAVADPATGTLPIPNVAPDVGLSAPFNSVFTLFGQFFDHGLDLVSKSGGKVFMPLDPDDPLYVEGGHTNFMVLTRSTNQPGPDGKLGTADDVSEETNHTAPLVDQSQTYTSHPSLQVFVREYVDNAAGDPVSTGNMLTGPDGGLATWASVKQQASDLLGIRLSDTDVLDMPLLATDPYGEFDRGPDGYPQILLADGTLLEGDPAANGGLGVDVPANAVRTDQAFLVDIAHHAVPFGDPTGRGGRGQPLTPDADTDSTTPDRNSDGSPNWATYDDEMLDAHFITGDGRANENFGLTAIHHVFHAEHNRLTGHIKDVLLDESPADLLAEYQLSPGAWDGERVFQAAKFVNEMEYQHLAFEEFARKVQPMVNAFGEGGTGYNTAVNPAIQAEFAHAVYRFGHSMLTETVARKAADGRDISVSLLDAFLNPPGYDDDGTGTPMSPEDAAGSILRGMSRQVGNEIDEFVTGALRSNLLGLPLDLAAINIARGRETGVPPLNETRRQFYAESGNSALKPYTSWTDFGFNLRHRESLVNFVAAYGTHPSIERATTVADKRAAAQLLVDADSTNPDTPVDAEAFMHGAAYETTDQETGGTTVHDEWVNGPRGVTTTGVDDIDLWVGGLAEKQMVFGGLLGSTFNYVFELQMEDLQFGDRFYYLSRTAGLNLLVQLEGNSFAELIQRTTDVSGLPADVFSRPDYIFNVGRLGTEGPITDDPTTEYDESDRDTEPGMHLSRVPAGTLRYSGPAHSVFNGTAGDDRVWASEGDDTIRGNDGHDWMQGGDGVDNLIGGLGDDIMHDLFGDDILKGGDGDDALSSGQGFGGDLNQGGRGKDFILGGNDDTETFAGGGDDLVFAGDGMDTVFGDGGDDWIEGGAGPFNLLQGDSGNPFQNDPNGGHDVLDGDGGEQDFDAEGGDDIMLMGPGIQRAEGMLGFDWTTHQGDPQPADSDMLFTDLTRPAVDTLRDRFGQVEALSGWKFDDVLRGDSRLQGEPPAVPADPDEPEEPEAPEEEVEAAPEDHTLDRDGIDRIDGLARLLPAGTTSFNTGNIILGGGGSDTLEGRGGDDIIDGDRWLRVQLRAPDLSTPDDPADTRLVPNLHQLKADVFAGRIDPGDIEIVRAIEPSTGTNAVDTAVFSDMRHNYDCVVDGEPVLSCPTDVSQNQTVTVSHAAGDEVDGTDTLTEIEALVFSDSVPPGAPTNVLATAGNASATVTFSAPRVGSVTGFLIRVVDGAGVQIGPLRTADADASSLRVTGLVNGETYRFEVRAVSDAGPGPYSTRSNAVTPAPTEPGAPIISDAVPGNEQVTLTWDAPDDGGAAFTGFEVTVVDATNAETVHRVDDGAARRLTVDGLINGRTYWFRVLAVNAVGSSIPSAEFSARPGTAPARPGIGRASRRRAAAVVRWQAPEDTGGLGISGYLVQVLNRAGRQVGPLREANAAANRLRVRELRNGQRYWFRVAALNPVGQGRFSRRSNRVRPATRPEPPRIRRARSGARGGRDTATARWRRPESNGGDRITGYRVKALRLNRNGTVVSRRWSRLHPADTRRFRMRLHPGRYRFRVRAFNDVGRSRWSRRSNVVRSR